MALRYYREITVKHLEVLQHFGNFSTPVSHFVTSQSLKAYRIFIVLADNLILIRNYSKNRKISWKIFCDSVDMKFKHDLINHDCEPCLFKNLRIFCGTIFIIIFWKCDLWEFKYLKIIFFVTHVHIFAHVPIVLIITRTCKHKN